MQPEPLTGRDAPTELDPSPQIYETEQLAVPLATGQQLDAGSVLEGRFRIVRMLGQGGMGEVYEAVDVALGTRVALKTVRLEQAANENALHRFRREILLARKIAHPNVCKVFELHVGGAGEPPVFLSMELLEGETLSARLKRDGRLAEEVARGIVLQIAAGLAAAHAEGVIHRDLKASNVMLVPIKGGGERAVVTDFGIAHAASGFSDSTATLDGPIGTPAYMAPEQVTGGEMTPATDLYCLGVLMYELTTGSLPFSGETPAQTAYRRLGAEPPDPRISNPSLSKRWSRLVRWCLSSEPARRPQTAEAFRQALEGVTRPPSRLSRPRIVAIIGLALAVVAGVTLGFRVPRLRRAHTPAAVTARPVVAVLEAGNVTGDAGLDWLSTAFSEAFASSLEPTKGLRIVPPRIVAERQFSLGVATAPQLGTSDGTRRLAEAVGASDIVELRFRRDERGRLMFLASVRSGAGKRGGSYAPNFAPAAEAEEAGSPEEVGAIAARLVASIRSQLRWERGAPEIRSPLIPMQALPRDPEARRLYARGLRHLARQNVPEALLLVRRAQQREPEFVAAMTLLRSNVFSILGLQLDDSDLLERGMPHVAKLSATSPERRWIESMQKAGRVDLRSLLAESADDFEFALQTASLSPDFVQQLAALRTLPPPLGVDPRTDFVEAMLLLRYGDLSEAAQPIRRGLDQARRREDRLMVSWFLGLNAVLEIKEGHTDDGAQSFFEAEREALAAGSAALAREHRFVRAWTLERAGRLKTAGQLYRQLLAEFQELGEAGEELRQMNLRQLAELEVDLGHFEAAHEIARQMKDAPGMEFLLRFWEIRVGESAPQREEAFREQIRACKRQRCAWLWSTWLGQELVAQGRPAEALKILAETGQIPDLWEQVTLYAQAMTDQGKAAEAYSNVLARVRDDVRTRGVITTYEGWRANQGLAICLLGMHELDEAARVIARMARFHRSWEDVEGHSIGLALEAELAVPRGTIPPDLGGLLRAQHGVPEMKVFPRVRAELEVQLGRLLLATGKAREGSAFLARAERESTARGELRTARLARAALDERRDARRLPPPAPARGAPEQGRTTPEPAGTHSRATAAEQHRHRLADGRHP